MGSLYRDVEGPRTPPERRLAQSDREQMEAELRATRQKFEPELAKQVMLEMLEGYDTFYLHRGGSPIDIEELRRMVRREEL